MEMPTGSGPNLTVIMFISWSARLLILLIMNNNPIIAVMASFTPASSILKPIAILQLKNALNIIPYLTLTLKGL